MNLRAIETEEDYDWALAEIEHYFDHEPAQGTKHAVRFRILTALIENYEAKHWRIPAADPIEAIKAHMEQLNKTQADLASLFGSRSRASEVLNRKRGLTMEQAFKLNREWRIPAESLLQEPVRKRA